MDSRFKLDNSHLEDAKRFSEMDPELRQLKSLRFVFQFPVLEKFPKDSPGIYTLCGAYRVGKTTLLKKWIEKLLAEGVQEKAIVFLSGTTIQDSRELERLLQKQIASMPSDMTLYVILDDVISIHDWEKVIAKMVNAESLNHVTLMLSGSDFTLENTQKKFPGQHKKNFYLRFLSFREAVLLKHNSDMPTPQILFEEFNHYILHGGYLDAINDIAMHGAILDKTLTTYADWIFSAATKHGRQEQYLREILHAILKHYNTQITWNALAQELTIDHPKTIGDYFALLESMDLVFVQYALIEKTLKPAPKKARKLMFTDPFIFHAIQAWVSSGKNYYETQMKAMLDHPENCSKLVETCVITQFRRYFPTYYIKAAGEVDLAYIYDQRFWPIETTWTSQMRAKDLKQILKYSNGRIFTKTERSGIIEHIRTEPLPLALWQLEMK